MQEISIGARVQVVNQTLDGNEFIEGYAIVKGIDGVGTKTDNVFCSVQFDDGSQVYRWIRQELI